MIVTDRLHASILALFMGIPHVIIDDGPQSDSYGHSKASREAAFETSMECTPENLRYENAATISEAVSKAVKLLREFSD